jgi:DNA-binding transcriptional ArsR family regulator
VGNVHITERDRRILAFAAEQRFVLAAHIGTLLEISTPAASARLRALREAGYLTDSKLFEDEPRLYQVRTAGLRAIGSDLPRPPKVDLSLYRHEAGLAWLSVAAHRGMFGSLQQVVSERRMRSEDRRAGDRQPPFGVRLGGVGRDGRPRLHYPDLVLVTDTGHRIAFELELTMKEPRRRERILAAYAADQQIDAVIYLVDHPARRRAMQESVRRVGIADRVRVEQVTLAHRPDPPASGPHAVQRTVRRGSESTGAGR